MPSCRKIVLRKGAKLRRLRRRAGAGGGATGGARITTGGRQWGEASSTSASPSPHFRLAAVLVEALICHRDERDSLTCSSSVIEPPDTRGYLEKPYPNRQFLPTRRRHGRLGAARMVAPTRTNPALAANTPTLPPAGREALRPCPGRRSASRTARLPTVRRAAPSQRFPEQMSRT